MPALALGLEVGLMALTRRTPSGGDRLLTLHSSPYSIEWSRQVDDQFHFDRGET